MWISKMQQKIEKNVFFFSDNFFWTDCSNKFSLLQKECVSLAVYLLTNSGKISDITKREIFLLNFPQSDEEI